MRQTDRERERKKESETERERERKKEKRARERHTRNVACFCLTRVNCWLCVSRKRGDTVVRLD